VDRDAGGGLVDDGLAGGVGGQQRGQSKVVDRPWDASGVVVDLGDGIVGEQGVRAADRGQVWRGRTAWP